MNVVHVRSSRLRESSGAEGGARIRVNGYFIKRLCTRNAGTALLDLASTSFRKTRIQNLSRLSSMPFLAANSSGGQAAVSKAPYQLDPRRPWLSSPLGRCRCGLRHARGYPGGSCAGVFARCDLAHRLPCPRRYEGVNERAARKDGALPRCWLNRYSRRDCDEPPWWDCTPVSRSDRTSCLTIRRALETAHPFV